MREYAAIKPTVYVETSVVSYLTSLPSRDSLVFSRQEMTRQLLFEYSDSFEFIEEIKMKEKPEPPTDPVLEEIYRMKAEFNAQFNSMEELNAYLKEVNAQEKARGRKYIPAPPLPLTLKKE